MEDPDVPTEQLHEEMHHQAESATERWILGVALSSALLAGLTALASLHAGHTSNEAMIAQIESANEWSHFQSKSIKEAQLKSKIDILDALGKPITASDRSKLVEYEKEKEEIQRAAEAFQKTARDQLHLHHSLSRSVTMFQIAIAIGAISVLTKRRRFWLLSLAFGCVGLFFMAQSLFTLLHH
jgi:hypothetical protein